MIAWYGEMAVFADRLDALSDTTATGGPTMRGVYQAWSGTRLGRGRTRFPLMRSLTSPGMFLLCIQGRFTDCTRHPTPSIAWREPAHRSARRFRQKTCDLPRDNEAEHLIVMRVAVDIFRKALTDYWNATCPLKGITDPFRILTGKVDA
jgi:hypothetical protein